MRIPYQALVLILPLLPAFGQDLDCPGGAKASSVRQGNTLTLSCLNPQGIPHGPFEVWAYADTLLGGTGTLLVEGRFKHGKQNETWTTYSKDGKALDHAEYQSGNKLEGTDAESN